MNNPTFIEGRVTDAETGKLQPCWVTLTTPDGTVLDDWKVDTEWHGFPCDGTFKVACPAGRITVRLRRFISHQEVNETVEVAAGQTVQRAWKLQRWVHPAQLHFVGGESHDHINEPQTAEQTVQYCRALGLDYVNLCQSWTWNAKRRGHISGDALADMLAKASTPDMRLHFGAERPKTRYGHVWWINLKPFADPFGEYMSWHDPSYVDYVANNPQWPDDLQQVCPLKNELPFTSWRRYRKHGGAFAAAHPTSWWLAKPGDEQIITNITAETPFALLSGEGPDALVAMGYDPEQPFYQNLWFNFLNQGYLLPAIGETDGCLSGPHHIGQIITYTRLDPQTAYSPNAMVEAIKAGRSLMTSGPFIRFELDGGAHRMGDKVRIDGKPHTLNIEAWSASDPNEALSWIVVYRNGEVFHARDLRDKAVRHLTLDLPVQEKDAYAWFVVKAYGKQGPKDPAWIDVFKYVALCEKEPHDEYRYLKQVALTNPIWFLPPGWHPPTPVSCKLDLLVTDEQQQPLAGALVRVLDGETTVLSVSTDASGRVQGVIPPTSEIYISASGRPNIRRSIFLDYRPVNACMEWCLNGKFRKDIPHLLFGQVPWPAFKFQELKKALSEITWTIAVPRE